MSDEQLKHIVEETKSQDKAVLTFQKIQKTFSVQEDNSASKGSPKKSEQDNIKKILVSNLTKLSRISSFDIEYDQDIGE